MNILVTGCGGMLGEAVWNELKDYHTVYASDCDVNEQWLHYLDVRYPDQVNKFFRIVKPNVVLHLAALTDMEYCELNPQHAYDVNFYGTLNVARATKDYNASLVYISSAGIFDGAKETYTEADTPNPLNVYAKSKYAGELVASCYIKSIIIRAGWMMGGGPKKDKKFVNKLVKQIRAGAKELFVVSDKLGTPTYTYELAKIIRLMVENQQYGIFHGACDGGGSRVDVARVLLENLGKNDISLCEVKSDHFKREYFAKRPHSEKLTSIRIGAAPPWQDCLKDYITRFEWKI